MNIQPSRPVPTQSRSIQALLAQPGHGLRLGRETLRIGVERGGQVTD